MAGNSPKGCRGESASRPMRILVQLVLFVFSWVALHPMAYALATDADAFQDSHYAVSEDAGLADVLLKYRRLLGTLSDKLSNGAAVEAERDGLRALYGAFGRADKAAEVHFADVAHSIQDAPAAIVTRHDEALTSYRSQRDSLGSKLKALRDLEGAALADAVREVLSHLDTLSPTPAPAPAWMTS